MRHEKMPKGSFPARQETGIPHRQPEREDPLRADQRFGAAHRRRLKAGAPDTATAPGTPAMTRAWHRATTRQILVFMALAGLALLLRDRLIALDITAIVAELHHVSARQWALALLATAVSYWSLGHYDVVIHRMLNTGMTARAASTAGAAAIAISQTVGFGLVSGALVRWRLSPDLTLVQASKITALTAASFLMGWVVVTGTVLLALPVDLPAGRALGLLGLGVGIAALILSVAMPRFRVLGQHITLPSTALMIRVVALAALDTVAAGAALWVLLPPHAGPDFAVLLPVFMVALGAGFLSGSPGGIGPFEITLLALLPSHAAQTTDQTAVLGAVLAWRGAYFALPAAIAGLAIVSGALGLRRRSPSPHSLGQNQPTERSPFSQHTSPQETAQIALAPPATELTPRLAALIERAPRAELGLLRQGEHSVLLAGNARAGWMIGHARQTLIGLLDPFGSPDQGLTQALLPRLVELARRQGRIACLYKINARTAVTARKQGWTIAPVAREAWLRTTTFDLSTPDRAGLRRKLRKAQKSGLRICAAEGALPIKEMTALSNAWVVERGSERGFSMGRYTVEYASAQRVYLAYKGEALVGFATFHAGASEWALDLMRPRADAPDGTMHALLCAAIEEAKAFGIPRLSLAALPPEADKMTGFAGAMWKHAEAASGATGLKQFKSAFAPEWQTLYIAARGKGRLALAVIDISHIIRRPPPLIPTPTTLRRPCPTLLSDPISFDAPAPLSAAERLLQSGQTYDPDAAQHYAPRSRPS